MVIRAKPKATGLVDGARGEQLLVFSWRRLGAVKEGGGGALRLCRVATTTSDSLNIIASVASHISGVIMNKCSLTYAPGRRINCILPLEQKQKVRKTSWGRDNRLPLFLVQQKKKSKQKFRNWYLLTCWAVGSRQLLLTRRGSGSAWWYLRPS